MLSDGRGGTGLDGFNKPKCKSLFFIVCALDRLKVRRRSRFLIIHVTRLFFFRWISNNYYSCLLIFMNKKNYILLYDQFELYNTPRQCKYKNRVLSSFLLPHTYRTFHTLLYKYEEKKGTWLELYCVFYI